jgi:hypothetical protein
VSCRNERNGLTATELAPEPPVLLFGPCLADAFGELGPDREFESVLYSELVEIASAQGWKTKKTYNNCISPLRNAFDFGYKDLPGKTSPAIGLECFRLTKKDRPKIDPFSIHEAEMHDFLP